MGIFNNDKFKYTKTGEIVNLVYEDKDAFKNGTDIPFKTLKEVANYKKNYIAEATDEAVKAASTTMEIDRSVNKVIITYPFNVSSNSSVNVVVDREKTFKGMNGGDPVTKSKVSVIVKDTNAKVSKSKLKELEAELTKKLISKKY